MGYCAEGPLPDGVSFLDVAFGFNPMLQAPAWLVQVAVDEAARGGVSRASSCSSRSSPSW
jgi:hypothetical protein